MSPSTAIVVNAFLVLAIILALLGLLAHYGIRKGVQHDRYLLALTRLRFRGRHSAT